MPHLHQHKHKRPIDTAVEVHMAASAPARSAPAVVPPSGAITASGAGGAQKTANQSAEHASNTSRNVMYIGGALVVAYLLMRAYQ